MIFRCENIPTSATETSIDDVWDVQTTVAYHPLPIHKDNIYIIDTEENLNSAVNHICNVGTWYIWDDKQRTQIPTEIFKMSKDSISFNSFRF